MHWRDLIKLPYAQESIYRYYFPICNLNGKKIKSPFRVDNSPSFTIKKIGNWYIWKDWATNETGNCFDFVARYYGLDVKRQFNLLLGKIVEDLNYSHLLDTKPSTVIKLLTTEKQVKNEIYEMYKLKENDKLTIKYSKKAFNIDEIEYWKTQGINHKLTLDIFDVKSVSKAFIKTDNYLKIIYDYSFYKDIKDTQAKKFFYCFAYNYDNRFVKLYRPFYIDKWKSTVPHNLVCTKTLYGNDTLIITKAKKEQMHFFELNKYLIDKFDILPLNNEVSFLDWYYQEIKLKYKHIVLWLDSDKAGISMSKKLNQMYNLKYVTLNIGKNITDVYSNNYSKLTIDQNIRNSLCLINSTLSH